MTHITLKNEHSFRVRLLLAIVRLLGRESAAIDTEVVSAEAEKAAHFEQFKKESGFGGWSDDPRSTEEIIVDIREGLGKTMVK